MAQLTADEWVTTGALVLRLPETYGETRTGGGSGERVLEWGALRHVGHRLETIGAVVSVEHDDGDAGDRTLQVTPNQLVRVAFVLGGLERVAERALSLVVISCAKLVADHRVQRVPEVGQLVRPLDRETLRQPPLGNVDCVPGIRAHPGHHAADQPGKQPGCDQDGAADETEEREPREPVGVLSCLSGFGGVSHLVVQHLLGQGPRRSENAARRHLS